jgi:hypothetical protein
MIGEDGNDYAQDYLAEPGYLFLVVAYDLNKTDLASYKKINTFVDQCNTDGNYIIGLTASLQSDVEKLKQNEGVAIDFFSCDAITLKTIVRANPGVLLLKEGVVLGKWNVNQLPDYEKVKTEYLK